MQGRLDILLVEDNLSQALVLSAQLGDDYRVTHVASGEECLAKIGELGPDVVLMDVTMPGIDGFETCRRIRQDEQYQQLPIVFLSASDSLEARHAGYEAGGQDFIVKPVAVSELKLKLEVLLQGRVVLQRLRHDADHAFRTAMIAMSSAAELGVVMQSLQASFAAENYQTLAELMLRAAEQFGLQCSVQIRGKFGVISLNQHGLCSPLEISVLNKLANHARIFNMGSHTAVNFRSVSMVVRNMPKEDEERYGRLKDNLAFLLEAMDARVDTLDASLELKSQQRVLMSIIDKLSQTLSSIDQGCKSCRVDHHRIVTDLDVAVTRAISQFGLTQKQVDLLQHQTRSAVGDMDELTDHRESFDLQVMQVMDELNELVRARLN